MPWNPERGPERGPEQERPCPKCGGKTVDDKGKTCDVCKGKGWILSSH